MQGQNDNDIMNANTRDCLKDFIEQVEHLAHCCYVTVGEETVKAVIESGEALKKQLDSDETIP